MESSAQFLEGQGWRGGVKAMCCAAAVTVSAVFALVGRLSVALPLCYEHSVSLTIAQVLGVVPHQT